LARLGFDRLVADAGYPGSGMVPATGALLSLLALKLLDKERRSHIDDFNCDEVIGLFAGLNVPPKKSFATAYSYRTVRDQQRGLLQGWVKVLASLLFPEPEGFSLDFHPIPFRGDPAALESHYLPLRGKAGPSVLTFFALEQDSRCLCYSNANLTRDDQHGELIIRYAGRNRIEGGLGVSVNFFHLNCLASEVRLNVDLDAALTVIANGCYRWLASRLNGFGKADPKQLYRRFIETGGVVTIPPDHLAVRLDRRCHNPLLREAALDRDPTPIPWLGQRTIAFTYH
jgi:hypothetical protein